MKCQCEVCLQIHNNIGNVNFIEGNQLIEVNLLTLLRILDYIVVSFVVTFNYFLQLIILWRKNTRHGVPWISLK